MAAFAEAVDDRILTSNDFFEVKEALCEVLHRWRYVALVLGLTKGQVNTIQASHPGDIEACADDAIEIWLNRAHNEAGFGPPSWRKLVRAVSARAGGQNPAVAREIAQGHTMPGHTIAAVDDSADDIVTYPSAKPAVSTPQELSTVPPPLTANRSPCVVRQLTEKGEEITVDSHGIKLTRFPPHDSAKLCTAVEYSFGTVQVEDRSVERVLEAYKMKSWPHGVCAIVNNEMFSSHTKRVGTDIDEANLTQCFRLLGYSVEVYRNLTAHQIESVFSYYRMCNHSKFDSFIVCILSHGEEGHVFGTDSKSVNLRSIVGQLNADSCQSLAGKPKIFFIQACRGHDKVMGREIASDSGSVELPTPPVAESVRVVDDSTPVSIPQDADFYFGNATPPGKVAWRDMDHGSWYVSEICRVFSSLARYVDLDSMVTRVHDEVGTGYKNMNYRQAPESTTRLRKKVYFFD